MSALGKKLFEEEMRKKMAAMSAASGSSTPKAEEEEETTEREALFKPVPPPSTGRTLKQMIRHCNSEQKRKFQVFSKEDWHEDITSYIPAKDPNYHWDFDLAYKLLCAWEDGGPTAIYGPPGTGKTKLVEQLCAVTNRPYIRINGMEGLEPSDYIGMSLPINGSMEFVPGPAAIAVQHGAILAYDEPNKVSPAVSMCFQWLYERDNPALMLYGHHDTSQQRLLAHEHFRVVLCDNVRGIGDGADRYAATQVQDVSTINRMSTRLHMSYLPQTAERDLLLKRFPNFSERLVTYMVRMASLIRSSWDKGDMDIPYSIRDLISWGNKICQYGDVCEAFRDSYLNFCSDDEMGTIRRWWADVELEDEVGPLL